ncbi:hypothetical protein EMIHUDRAFT_254458 [Emiliania huxleyi CCMP1516]|uniref:Amino acid transporter transmembrane domain-containing protein n=2 Tax=Emiliania huxleyi TaxID=2903 RepID=A0A0D3JSY4_EMIH1|nr:hypothetical protein EMIHUDRAFT_254458 [Emiliania huxleyi CCMP1516]EOD26619.1 hypothetical protein EMIHUDRAFT_254458 [Emiliania huxleyi CCMP1516]|eukprot:XP_005779048.1 hypothetical protein EMIHUDRAFT_254458 [Emiliania huxleyi CCMP1516]
MAIGILPAVACPSTATAPSDTVAVAERLGFAQTSFVPCWRVRCHAFLRFSTFIVFVGAIAVVAVGAAEPSVVVDGTALVFRLPRFLYGRGDAGLGRLSGTIFDASADPDRCILLQFLARCLATIFSPSTASTQCLIDPPAVRQQRLQTVWTAVVSGMVAVVCLADLYEICSGSALCSVQGGEPRAYYS